MGTLLFEAAVAELLPMLAEVETLFKMSSDGGEARVEEDVAEDVALSDGAESEDAEPPVLLSELCEADTEASGVETLLVPFGRGSETVAGCCCCCSGAAARCGSI